MNTMGISRKLFCLRDPSVFTKNVLSLTTAKSTCTEKLTPSPETKSKSKQTLPPLPVPELYPTLTRFLRSARPFLTPEEYVQSENVVNQFGRPAGEGEYLQYLLLDKAKDMDNWLKNWWQQTTYLERRTPVTVFTSRGEIFTKQVFTTEMDMLKFAANIVFGALEFKEMIDNDSLPEENILGKPVDMSLYKQIFGTTRLPHSPSDRLVYHPDSQHIVVMVNNNLFKAVVKKDGKWISKDCIFEQLCDIHTASSCYGPPVGILTSDTRDNWLKAYKELIKNKLNIRSLKIIEEALFVVCLDSVRPPFCLNDMTTAGLQMIHGGGPSVNAGNRWFDKTIQFIFGKEGHCGITFENSPAEGTCIATLTDYLMENEKLKEPVDPNSNHLDETLKPVKICFTLSSLSKDHLNTAQCNLNKLCNDLELYCFSFDDFGNDLIKRKLKLSPDSLIQMAIQLAFYRIHNAPGAQDESATTRLFIDGRTETIRSCSEETMRFVKAMLNACIPSESKAKALQIAVEAHKEYTVAALRGRGVDRHLLGLKLIAKENKLKIPDLFKDISFTRSSHMRLDAGQVKSYSDSFMVYSPQVNDGYSICYNPRKKNINFGTSAFVSCDETNVILLKEGIEKSLNEIKQIVNSMC